MRDKDDKLTFYYDGLTGLKIVPLIKAFIKAQEHELTNNYDPFKIDVYILLDKKNSKYIAIDWDNTISADPQCFAMLINNLQKLGYRPFICTLRAPDEDNIKEIKALLDKTNIPIHLTDGQKKRKFMKKKGIKVHLWIDDFYPGICGDTSKLLIKNNIK